MVTAVTRANVEIEHVCGNWKILAPSRKRPELASRPLEPAPTSSRTHSRPRGARGASGGGSTSWPTPTPRTRSRRRQAARSPSGAAASRSGPSRGAWRAWRRLASAEIAARLELPEPDVRGSRAGSGTSFVFRRPRRSRPPRLPSSSVFCFCTRHAEVVPWRRAERPTKHGDERAGAAEADRESGGGHRLAGGEPHRVGGHPRGAVRGNHLGAAAGRHRHHALRGIHDLPPRVRMLVDAVPGGQPQSKRPHDN